MRIHQVTLSSRNAKVWRLIRIDLFPWITDVLIVGPFNRCHARIGSVNPELESAIGWRNRLCINSASIRLQREIRKESREHWQTTWLPPFYRHLRTFFLSKIQKYRVIKIYNLSAFENIEAPSDKGIQGGPLDSGYLNSICWINIRKNDVLIKKIGVLKEPIWHSDKIEIECMSHIVWFY